jgi:hypothetical protein
MFLGASVSTSVAGAFSTVTGNGQTMTMSASAGVSSLAPGQSVTVLIVLGHYYSQGRYGAAYANSQVLFNYVVQNSANLFASSSAFVASIPRTGNALTDESIRWYLQAPLLLTKGVLNQTITMGYAELNQRDSFWTTWIHTHLWPDLDYAMLLESSQWQQADGHIPTTCLPLILRDDNEDITAYFIARVARHLQITGNLTAAANLYPAMQRAMAYLQGRDLGDGVPSSRNTSYWADWLDVPCMQGRRHAPHFDLLYLVALRASAQVATALGHVQDAQAYNATYNRGFNFVNTPFQYYMNQSTGLWETKGLWNTSSFVYQDAWYDGRTIGWAYSDQMVGVFFGVVPSDRAVDIMVSLGAGAMGNENSFGVRNLYPYVDWSGYGPGDRVNGGVWPWINCFDAVARYNAGHQKEGARIFNEMSQSMLYKSSNILHGAWEFLNGEDGSVQGEAPQGWDGACWLLSHYSANGETTAKWHRHGIAEVIPFRYPTDASATLPANAQEYTLHSFLSAEGAPALFSLVLSEENAEDLRSGAAADKEYTYALGNGKSFFHTVVSASGAMSAEVLSHPVPAGTARPLDFVWSVRKECTVQEQCELSLDTGFQYIQSCRQFTCSLSTGETAQVMIHF